MKHKRYGTKKRSFAGVMSFEAACTLIALVGLTFAASLILTSMKNPIAAVGIATFAVMSATGAFSGFCTSKFTGGNASLSLVSSLTLALFFFGVGLILGNGKASTVSLVNIASYLAFAALFAAVARKKNRRHR